MSKKNENLQAENNLQAANEKQSETVNNQASKSSQSKKEKNNQKSNNKPGFFKRMGAGIKRAFSGMFSELKKVSWPTFGKALKQTGVVFAVVLFFLVIVTLFDLGLNGLVGLLGA